MIQFLVPSSLSVWIQRAGRCGRNGQPSNAYLYVQPSVFQKKKARRRRKDAEDDAEDAAADLEAEGDDDDTDTRPLEFMKKIEEALRLYVETEICRRKVADKYFNNPRRTDGERSTYAH